MQETLEHIAHIAKTHGKRGELVADPVRGLPPLLSRGMRVAILPPRLRDVMAERGMTRDDVGDVFAQVLEHAGVFKWDDAGRAAFRRFVGVLGK